MCAIPSTTQQQHRNRSRQRNCLVKFVAQTRDFLISTLIQSRFWFSFDTGCCFNCRFTRTTQHLKWADPLGCLGAPLQPQIPSRLVSGCCIFVIDIKNTTKNYTKLYLLLWIYFNTCLFPLSEPHLHALTLIFLCVSYLLLNEIKERSPKMLEGKSWKLH